MSASQYTRTASVVEAFQLTEETRVSNVNWPSWLHEAWNKPAYQAGALYSAKQHRVDPTSALKVRTVQGEELVEIGDWLVNDSDFGLYGVKESVFVRVFELVPEAVPVEDVLITPVTEGELVEAVEAAQEVEQAPEQAVEQVEEPVVEETKAEEVPAEQAAE